MGGRRAQAVAKTCVAPLERVKLLCQIEGMQLKPDQKRTGVFRMFAVIARTGGVRGFWTGNFANVSPPALYQRTLPVDDTLCTNALPLLMTHQRMTPLIMHQRTTHALMTRPVCFLAVLAGRANHSQQGHPLRVERHHPARVHEAWRDEAGACAAPYMGVGCG